MPMKARVSGASDRSSRECGLGSGMRSRRPGCVFLQVGRKNTVADITDAMVSAGTTYSYQLIVYEFHFNSAVTTVPVTTPPTGWTIRAEWVSGPRVLTGAGAARILMCGPGNLSFAVPLLGAFRQTEGVAKSEFPHLW